MFSFYLLSNFTKQPDPICMLTYKRRKSCIATSRASYLQAENRQKKREHFGAVSKYAPICSLLLLGFRIDYCVISGNVTEPCSSLSLTRRLAQPPHFSSTAPRGIFSSSTPWHKGYSQKMSRPVKFDKITDTGTTIAHIKPESSIIVIPTLPPERRVKYDE